MAKYIDREAAYRFAQDQIKKETGAYSRGWNHALGVMKGALHNNDAIPTADVAPVSEIEKIIESLQEQADIYNARAKELLVEEDGQVSQYTWAVSLRETYRRIIKILDDLIS